MNKNELTTLNHLNALSRELIQFPFQSIMSDMINEFLNSFIPSERNSITNLSTGYPKCDIKEYPEKFQIEMHIPGMKKQDVNIEYDSDNQFLIVSGNKSNTVKQENVNYIRRQLKKSQFKRVFYIPKDQIDNKEIKAQFSDGVLILDIPKVLKAKNVNPKTQKIEIN